MDDKTKDGKTEMKKEAVENIKAAGQSEEEIMNNNEVKTDTMSTNEFVKCENLKEENDMEKGRNESLPDVGKPINFKVVCNKAKYDIEFPVQGTVKQLKEHLSPIISILPSMQKVMIKGLANNDKTLEELGISKGSKIMVIGSTLNDVVNVNAPSTSLSSEVSKSEGSNTKESFSNQKIHQKILAKGIPDDVTPGFINAKESLPLHPVSGMLNKYGGKVRLTFKLEVDQVWIGTKERTQKIRMNSINSVVSESIEGHEEYHIMAFQLGPTEASRYWIYWVPSQYVDAIKATILGKW